MADPNEVEHALRIEAKRELRERMRSIRRQLPDRSERSARIVERLASLEAVTSARRLMAYASVVGEVETGGLIAWCAKRGIETAVPEDDPDAAWPDVIIVPGTAFTVDGARIGQGGGWYDRFLTGRIDGVVLIGVAFAPQILGSIPTEPHDVNVDLVVTDEAVYVVGLEPFTGL